MAIYRILLTILFISGLVTGVTLAAYYSGQVNGIYVSTEVSPNPPLSRDVVNLVFHFQNATTFDAMDIQNLRVEISKDGVPDTIAVEWKPHRGHYEANYTFESEGRYFVAYTFSYGGKQYNSGFYIDVKPNFFVTDKSRSQYGLAGIAAITGLLVLAVYVLYRRR
jgi:hypothetical protein